MKRISIYKRAAGIVVLMACALSGWAQVAVGAIEGSGGASGLGGATYTIPIKVPEGLGGIQPSLAVAYNSQGGNGLLGWCWDLQGTSAITRMGTTQYHDGEVSGVDFVNDRFALDGQRLVCVSGSYDGNGAEYRTESDGMAKIVSYRCDTTGGAACFKVWLPNGNIAYYGYTEDSRIGLQQRHNVCLWLLNRLEDRNGNAMDYQYVRGGASYRLSRIDYGGNDDAGIPYSYSVRFHYSTKDDREISFIGDNILVQNKRLDSIRVMHGSTELHKYLFDYHVPDPANGYYYTRLHQVRFVCGGESYNPTVVQWGQNDYGSYGSGQCRSIAVSGGSPSDFSGKIKFPGDFNGDGYTDFILYYPNLNGDKKAVFFINQGETTLLSQTHPLFVQHASDITLPGSIDWIYTADINGDGLDDILLSSRQWVLFGRDRLNLSAYLSSVGADGSYSFSPVQQSFGEFRIKKKYKDALYAGDFLGEGKQSFLLQECEDDKSAPRLFYITYSNGSLTAEQLPQNMVLDADRMFACDFNGDGKSEIYFMNEDTQTTGLLRIRRTSTSYLYQSVNNYMLSPWHQVFPGDFNGDGKPDLLTYVDDGNGNASWHINYFKESELYWPELPFSEQAFGIGDPKTHGYSLKYFDDPDYKFITVGDFNGDGKADVAVRTGNDEMKFLYGPVKNVNGQGQFSSSQTVSLSAIGMSGASNQSFCVGNFLGRENMSMFSASTLHALNPVSNRYSVVHVTDGMGNRTAFEYDYLMPKPTGASDADFYTRTMQTGTEQAADMFTVSLPMKALSRMTSSNIHCTAPAGEIRYRYGNAVVHKKGRGFLGFKSTTAESWLSSEKRQTVERLSETLTTVPSLALHTERTRRSDGAVVSLTVYDNDILLNRYPTTSIHKAFVPVVRAHTTFKYDPGHPQLLLSKTVTKYAYNDTLVNSSAYGQVSVYGILKQTMARQGVDTVAAGYSVSSCEFQTITQTTYMSESPSDLQDWIVNRPRTVKTTARRLGGYPDVMALTVNRYPSGGTANPFLPVRVDSYPGGVESALDSLATYDSTAYSATGSVAERYMGDVMGRLPVRRWSYGYSADGRFMTRQVDPAADTTTYAYDSHYGHLISETDCNGLATTYQSSPLGTSFTTHHPDRRVTQGGVSWDGSDPYAPYGAYYLKWSSTTGGGLGKTYYDAAGRKLRTLTQGMDGDPILKDFEYNDRGLLNMESLPYYLGDAVYWTEYKYDDYDRTLFVDHPDGMSEVFWYNGPVTTHLRYLDDPDDPVFTTTTVNAMGWTVNSTDENGNSVVYDYNADGKLRTTQLGSDAATAVWIDYDAAGNRIVLEDPNYGGIRSVYDAYGQLILTVNPTGEDTSYEYDLLGRMVKRRERNRLNNTIDSTVWTYSEYPGKKGLLEYVNFNGKQQVLWYLYDTLCRVSAVSEMRGTDFFDTRYAYDTLSRVTSVTYPSGYTMRKEYTATGHLRKLRGDSGELLWETLSKNAMGQVTGYTTGDGMATERRYDPLTGRLTGILTHNSTDTIQNLWYVYDKSANLTSRTDSLRNTTERFTYDRLDRLTGVVEGTDTTGVFVYDDYGRMTSKRLHGAMVFDQALFEADGRPHAIRSARMYANPADLTMDYTSFDKLRLVEQGDRTLSYVYGYEHQRLRMVETDDHDTVRMKEYVGGCERVTEVDGNYSSTHWITFLGGPLGVFAVRDTRMQPPAKQMYYVHPDHLGSWTTVTSWNGNVVQDVWFDPWGTAYDLTTLTDPYPEADSLLFDRGFTGHEHLLGFGLINMNGRVYDPLTSSFLSVDNYVQDPSYTQNFNRYAYCMNNPLKYTDPSGEFLTWSFNHKGFSLGINLTPIGIPIGFGINVSWANGGSVGVYGEIAYRAGGTGFGFGGGFQQSLDYSFKYKSLSTTSSVNAYYSFGCITIGASASYYYNMTYAQGDWGWNIGVGAAWNPNMPYSSYGQSMGFGLGISYGSGGLNYGINGYYQGLSLQDKLDILVDRYKAEMTSAIGDADPQVLVGSNSNFRKNGVAAHNCYGDIWDEKNNVRANGLTEQGIALGIIEIDGQPYASLDSDIYISKNTIRQLWKGSEYGKRTLFHEWVHAHDYYSGQASYWFSLSQDNSVLRIRMETHAYKFVNDYFPNLPPITFHP